MRLLPKSLTRKLLKGKHSAVAVAGVEEAEEVDIIMMGAVGDMAVVVGKAGDEDVVIPIEDEEEVEEVAVEVGKMLLRPVLLPLHRLLDRVRKKHVMCCWLGNCNSLMIPTIFVTVALT